MTARLLLDEMFHPRIATELTARGHDCIAVAADADLRESSDTELIIHALTAERALVTNNVVDFEHLRRHRTETGEYVPSLIYTSDATFPRDRRFIGRLIIAALEHVCATDATATAGGVLWLQPAHHQ